MNISGHITITVVGEIEGKFERVTRQSLLLGCVWPMTDGSEKKA